MELYLAYVVLLFSTTNICNVVMGNSDIVNFYFKSHGANFAFSGSVFTQTFLDNEMQCSKQCALEPECLSYNYYTGGIHVKRCELMTDQAGECHTSSLCCKLVACSSCKSKYKVLQTDSAINPSAECSDSIEDCSKIYTLGYTENALYKIKPNNGACFDVYCDMVTECGGWTVFQTRVNDSVLFNRVWSEYKAGFGNLLGNFWLGNDALASLTANSLFLLRLEMRDENNVDYWIECPNFQIGDETTKYIYSADNCYGSTSADANALTSEMDWWVGMQFSTTDRDYDTYVGECSNQYGAGGGWWYSGCGHLFPNSGYDNIWVTYFTPRIIFTEMKIRPMNM